MNTIESLTSYIAIGSVVNPISREVKVQLAQGLRALARAAETRKRSEGTRKVGIELLVRTVQAQKRGAFRRVSDWAVRMKLVGLKKKTVEYGTSLMQLKISKIETIMRMGKKKNMECFFLKIRDVVKRRILVQAKKEKQEIEKVCQRKVGAAKFFRAIEICKRKRLTYGICKLKELTVVRTQLEKSKLEKVARSLELGLDNCKAELQQQLSLNLAIRADYTTSKSSQANLNLDLQKAQAKLKVLESENLSIITQAKQQADRYENHIRDLKLSASKDVENERAEREKMLQEVKRVRGEFEDLQTRLEGEFARNSRLTEVARDLEGKCSRLDLERKEAIQMAENYRKAGIDSGLVLDKFKSELNRAIDEKKTIEDKLIQVSQQRENEKNWLLEKSRHYLTQMKNLNLFIRLCRIAKRS